MKFLADWWHGKTVQPDIGKVGQRTVILAGEDEPKRHWTSKLVHTVVSFVIRNETALLTAFLAGLGYYITKYFV